MKNIILNNLGYILCGSFLVMMMIFPDQWFGTKAIITFVAMIFISIFSHCFSLSMRRSLMTLGIDLNSMDTFLIDAAKQRDVKNLKWCLKNADDLRSTEYLFLRACRKQHTEIIELLKDSKFLRDEFLDYTALNLRNMSLARDNTKLLSRNKCDVLVNMMKSIHSLTHYDFLLTIFSDEEIMFSSVRAYNIEFFKYALERIQVTNDMLSRLLIKILKGERTDFLEELDKKIVNLDAIIEQVLVAFPKLAGRNDIVKYQLKKKIAEICNK